MVKLALYGGTPVRSSMLHYGKQWVDEDDVETVIRTLRSDFLTQGPAIEQFERKVAAAAGVEYAVAFMNGTAALHGAMYAAGIREGDEVITTPLTFVATSNSILYQGGTPVFADVDPRTFLLDLESTARSITDKTKAITAVDLTGQSVDMLGFRKLADDHGLIFIQDAAHSLGASYDGKPVGSIADMTMFSFHPVKPVTTGEGGVIVTNNPDYYEKMLLFRSHGITRSPKLLEAEDEGPWYYEMQHLGFNYRMTDLQASLGVSQIDKLESFIARRSELAKCYDEGLYAWDEQGYIQRPYIDRKAKSGWHLYVIQINSSKLGVSRRTVFDALRAENIGVNVHYVPVHLHPYYRDMGYRRGVCPIAEQLYETFITLPLYPRMSDEDVQDVISAVGKVIQHFANERIAPSFT
jgi:perosamine synthetase